jgi:glycosyltransferase involved in cell wall biosynthesis
MRLGSVKMNTTKYKISILIPVYNEEETLAHCIQEAKEAIFQSKLKANIIVIDNNSQDNSVEIANSKKVNVIHNKNRGYGANLHYGIINSGADIVFFADADGSYPFSEFKNFMKIILDEKTKVDFVLGNRFSNNMEKGAMPILNKYIGTPILTFFINYLFNSEISDCNCGMRAIRTDSYKKLGLTSPGMEYASEMIIKSIKQGLIIKNHTFKFAKDLRSKEPHLDRWVDGWRHLRYILCSTNKNIIITIPGLLTILFFFLSLITPLANYFLDSFPFHSCLIFIVLYVLSITIFITFFSNRLIMHFSNEVYCKIIEYFIDLEKRNKLMSYSFFSFSISIILLFYVIIIWFSNDFNQINEYSALIWMSLFGISSSFIFFMDVVISNMRNIININN